MADNNQQLIQSDFLDGKGDGPPYGLKGEIAQKLWITPYDVVVFSAVVLVVAVLFSATMRLIYYFRHKSTIKPELALENSVNKWVHLKSEIGLIRVPVAHFESQGSDKFKWSEFSSAVSLCLRRAIELKTGLPLAERTNQEISEYLSRCELVLPELTKEQLSQILQRLDFISYGGVSSEEQEASNLLNFLKKLVDDLASEDIKGLSTETGVRSGENIFD